VLGTQTPTAPNPPSAAPTSFIDLLFQSPELIAASRLLFEVVGLALIATVALYGAVWAYQRQPRRRHEFIEAVRRFRAQITAAQEMGQDELWQQVDVLDDEAVKILSGLWQALRRGVDSTGREGKPRHGKPLTPKVRVQGVHEWESRARLLEHAIELFDLMPRTIVLPRALCVLRFKSTDFNTRTAISDWDFGASLGAAGFSSPEVDALKSWLSSPANQQRMQDWDVLALAQALKMRGVTAVPGKRTPARWHGPLDESPAR
jgi:hypothetical protein